MAIQYKANRVRFLEAVGAEDVEPLRQWLKDNPNAELDLSTCTQLHGAVLQVLIASKMKVARWPHEADLRAWLRTVLKSS